MDIILIALSAISTILIKFNFHFPIGLDQKNVSYFLIFVFLKILCLEFIIHIVVCIGILVFGI